MKRMKIFRMRQLTISLKNILSKIVPRRAPLLSLPKYDTLSLQQRLSMPNQRIDFGGYEISTTQLLTACSLLLHQFLPDLELVLSNSPVAYSLSQTTTSNLSSHLDRSWQTMLQNGLVSGSTLVDFVLLARLYGEGKLSTQATFHSSRSGSRTSDPVPRVELEMLVQPSTSQSGTISLMTLSS